MEIRGLPKKGAPVWSVSAMAFQHTGGSGLKEVPRLFSPAPGPRNGMGIIFGKGAKTAFMHCCESKWYQKIAGPFHEKSFRRKRMSWKNSKHIRADYNVAWPTSEMPVMRSKGAVEIIFRGEISKADDPVAKELEPEAEYAKEFAHPYRAAARGFIEDVI